MIASIGRRLCSRFIDNPIFIVGGSRSGTIALLKAMGEHKNVIAAPTEDPFITDVGRMALQLDFFSNHEREYYLRTLRISFEYILGLLHRLAIESAFGRNYGLNYFVLSAVKERVNILHKTRWCTKTFPGKDTTDGLLRLYPNAKFIWILRNGVNVVHSRTKFPEFRELPFQDHCNHWAQSIRRFGYFSELPQATMVKQEEFADSPDVVMRKIFSHVGVAYDPRPTEFSLTHHVHPLADEATTKGVDVKTVLSNRPPAYADWSDEWKSIFKTTCGDAMRIAGYTIEF